MVKGSEFLRLSQTVSPGTVLLREGDASVGLVILVQGTLGVYRAERKVAEIDEPGSYLGERSVFTGAPHSATIRAETTARVVQLDARAAENFLHAPDAEARLVRNMGERLESTTDRMIECQDQVVEQREVLGTVLETLTELYREVLAADDPGAARLRTLNTLLHLVHTVGDGRYTDETYDV